jgi:hypothetical protein
MIAGAVRSIVTVGLDSDPAEQRAIGRHSRRASRHSRDHGVGMISAKSGVLRSVLVRAA